MNYMTVQFDLDKTNEISGTRFDGSDDTLEYIQNALEWLKAHNKNYTQKQYWAISELCDIFEFAKRVHYEEEK